jgi:hypothetical protein
MLKGVELNLLSRLPLVKLQFVNSIFILSQINKSCLPLQIIIYKPTEWRKPARPLKILIDEANLDLFQDGL